MGSATGGAMTLAGAILVTVVVKTPVAWIDVARDIPTGGVSGFDGHRADDDGAHGSVSEPLSCPRRGDGKTGNDRDWGGENGFHDHDLSTMNYAKFLDSTWGPTFNNTSRYGPNNANLEIIWRKSELMDRAPRVHLSGFLWK